jgi:hypothetical protein
MKRLLAFLVIAIVIMPLTLSAQSSRHDRWRQDDGELERVLNQLREMIEEAERTRAADPRFLEDLRSLLRRRSDSRSSRYRLLLEETFADGNYTRNPAWTVASGRFEVSRQGGLLSDVSTYSYGSRDRSDRPLTNEEIVAHLLATVLNQRLRRGTSGGNERYGRGPAEIYLPLRVPNAFRIRMNFGAAGENGAFEFRVYQGERRQSGFALAYSERTGLTLLKRTRSGGEIAIKSARPAQDLFAGVEHRIDWVRKRNGEMIVRIDKKEVLRAVDTSFRDPFDGFRMLNGGGRQVLFALSISGAR